MAVGVRCASPCGFLGVPGALSAERCSWSLCLGVLCPAELSTFDVRRSSVPGRPVWASPATAEAALTGVLAGLRAHPRRTREGLPAPLFPELTSEMNAVCV